MHAPAFAVGIGLPIVQQVPTQAQLWEASAGPAEILRVARAAERAGFAWVTCSDHVAVPASHAPSMGATWYEPATTLAYVAAATERIHLLSHVLVLPYRHPLQAAKMFATLDRLSGGRAILGAGSGHLKPEFRSLGVDHDARAALSDEYLAAIAAALEHEVSSFAGAHVGWRDMHVAPRPVQQPRPPIWVGGNTPAMARRAGRLADGWIPWQLAPDEFAAGAVVARAARAERAAGLPFAVVAPVAGGTVDSPAALVETLADWRRRGAGAAHLGLKHRSLDHLLELLDRIGRDVLPLLGDA
jgi:probable F420-dependent oxidoreductase